MACGPPSPLTTLGPSRAATATPGQRYSKGWTTAVLAAGLALATFALYSPTAGFGFVAYDDGVYVFDNPRVAAGLSWENAVWASRAVCGGNWHPLTLLSLMADCSVFGTRPGPLHLANAALHVLSTGLCFLVFYWMSGRPWCSAAVAGLFGWHPAHVESVAWIAERKDVLSGVFFFLTLIFYVLHIQAGLGSVRAPDEGRQSSRDLRRFAWYAATFFSLALGLMSKPTLVTTPVLLLLLDYWPLARMKNLRSFWGLAWEKFPFFGLSLVVMVLTVWAQGTSGAMPSLSEIPFSQRIANAASNYIFYLGKVVWPEGLMIPYLPEENPSPMHPLWCALGVIFVSLGVLLGGRRWKYLVTGWVWYLVSLLPVVGLVQVGVQSTADRYTYLSAIGLFLLLAWGLADLVDAWRLPRWLGGLLTAGGLTACGLLTSGQISYWRNGETLFMHTLAVDPTNMVAMDCLAWTYATDPDPRVRNGTRALQLAEACAEETQRREPVYLMTLAAAQAELSQFDLAVKTAEAALRLVKPGSTTTFVKDLEADIELYRSGKSIYQRYRLKP
jgi:hypothetical protein